MGNQIEYEAYQERLKSMRADLDSLLHMTGIGVYHDDGSYDQVWLRVLTRLMTCRGKVDGVFTSELDADRQYPALLALWTAGVAAVLSRREEYVADLLLQPQYHPRVNDTSPQAAVMALHPFTVLNGDWVSHMPRWRDGIPYYAQSRLLRAECRGPLEAIEPDDRAYEDACDRFECLAAFVCMDKSMPSRPRFPWLGEFVADSRSDMKGDDLATRISKEIDDQWPLLRVGAFGGDIKVARKAAAEASAFINERARHW
jgi:hypothetical protein